MKLLFFASFILLCLFISSSIRRQRRIEEKKEEAFWEKERQANLTRKKPVEHLPYILLPMDKFPLSLLPEDENVQDIVKTIRRLNDSKILNLTGITNTDLKLEYGAANLTFLTECDQNYTLLVRTLQKWADILTEHGYLWEARIILEFAVETKTDVSATYFALAKIYREAGESEKIASLIETAKSLNSIMKNTIVRTLQESGPYNG